MDVKIISNYHNRKFLCVYDIPHKIREDQFDYMDDECFKHSQFIKYNGDYYSLGEFAVIYNKCPFEGWNGYASETTFSGVLIKVSDDGESYKIASYYN